MSTIVFTYSVNYCFCSLCHPLFAYRLLYQPLLFACCQVRAGEAVEEGLGHASRDAGGRSRGELLRVLLRDRRLREGTIGLSVGQ